MVSQMQGALAALAAFAAIAFASAPAFAHAGHRHPGPPAVAAAQSAAAEERAACVAGQALTRGAVQEFAAAAPAGSHHHDDDGCGDRGCCSNGPCTGCHGFILIAVPVPSPPILSSSLSIRDPPHGMSAAIDRLQRPPKSFA